MPKPIDQEAILLWVAQAMLPYKHLDQLESFVCPDCRDTFEVPAFPGLRKPCSCIDIYPGGMCQPCRDHWDNHVRQSHSSSCTVCQGRTWVPNDDPWTLIRGMGELEFTFLREAYGDCIFYREVTELHIGNTPWAAALLALEDVGATWPKEKA